MAAVAAGSRKGVPALMLVWFGIALALLAGSAAALYSSTKNDALVAYNSAPACATLDDAMAGKSCRYTFTAQVTDLGGRGQTTDVFFDTPGQYTSFWMGTLPNANPPVVVGSQVQVEVWQFKDTRIEGAATTDNPVNDSRPRALQVIGAILLLFGVGATAAGIAGARRRPGHAASPTMSPVAMSDVLWR